MQNFPVLTAAERTGTGSMVSVVIDGTLNSRPSKQYRIEFFHSLAADKSGHGEGRTYLGFQYVTTNGSGNASFSTNLPFTGTGGVISATATSAVGNTSEFSAARSVTPATSPVIQFSADVYPVNEGAGHVTVTVTRTGDTTGTSSVRYHTANQTAVAPADYQTRSARLTFAPHETSKAFNVPIVNDQVGEQNEVFEVLLDNAANAILPSDASASVKIADNDP